MMVISISALGAICNLPVDSAAAAFVPLLIISEEVRMGIPIAKKKIKEIIALRFSIIY